jgi:membrane protease YdiL (CAAX protease family)
MNYQTLSNFIKRYPVWIYFIFTFIISWGGVVVFSIPHGIPTTNSQFEKLWASVVLPYFLGPGISSLLMTIIIDGKAGFRRLKSQLIKWRVGIRWYLVALLSVPMVVIPLLIVFSLISEVFLPGILTTSNKVVLLISGIITGLLFGGVMEELGWTGFAVHTLRKRYSVVTTGIIVGVLHGLWHFPPKILISGVLGLTPFLLVDLLTAIVNLTAWRILMVWVFSHTGSLLVIILMHASLTANTLFILAPSVTGKHLLIYNLVAAAIIWVFVSILIMVNKRQFFQRPINSIKIQ